MVEEDAERMEVINMISLIKLIEGGAAILVILKMNHHKAINGNTLKRPLVRKSLRVDVNSYVLFAMANIAEEHRPWAIIIAKAPWAPQEDPVISPAVINPMCPTDE